MDPPVFIGNNIPPGPSVNIEDIFIISPWSAGPCYTGYYAHQLPRIIRSLPLKGLDGKPCPVVTDRWDLFDEDEQEDHFEPEDLPSVSGPEFQPKENTMVIVDKSGVHRLKVQCCDCPDAMSPDIQMFQHGFFPASFNKPKTVFTFRVLDDFLLDNLECGTSAMNYYSKLRRMTSSVFPHLVPDQYRELMRVARQWRQLKSMKWHGFGHSSDNPNARDFALFCLACPQPGINISLSGGGLLDDWKYTQSFVMDGNFKAEHLHPIKPYDEVWLFDGLGFMVGKEMYQKHLEEAADTVEKSSCNNHRAVNQANAAWHKLESTGIGGISRKAKGKLDMPFNIPELTHNMDGITRAVTFYDINCQYNKHLHVRVDRGRFLTMVPELTVIPGIGLWHMHGHQDSCYVRYASNFIEGIGCIDGEIMELLWARLNLISPAAQGMSSLHRKECLDFQMNDSNFCKMIRMKRTLCRKYKQAKTGIAESGKAFDRLDEAAPANLKTDWLASERITQSNRIQDPAAMDIYEINIKKGEITLSRSKSEFILNPALSKKEIELRLLQEDILDDLNDDLEDFIGKSDTWTNSPKLTVIPLPSNLGVDRSKHCMAEDLIPLESSLREGQANDALHNL
ncbi:uncharacterized protein EDB91DRAFT_1249240 [Suillus paluster]|uniref:uncharacterized protein n=1 Tax=Suillus paluster TaxID=48578 RepID=UPI001B88526E|nr:uncharacterized protein EDB91DRAFT_1249240 [Suillus paluster]KAG1738323.1 hypothetical protein EDB91DRAFT_1249240 [Suillus paluster]